MKKLILVPLTAFFPMLMFAGGFQVNLQGNQQAGMGHLGTSFYLGASSAYFNPGMMGLGEDTLGDFSFEAGVSLLFSEVAYQNLENGEITNTDNSMGTPFYFYGSYKVSEKIAAGLAIYTPFGSSVKWGDTWEGRYLVQDSRLQSIFFQPTMSYQISDNIGIGAGFVYATGDFEINRAFPYSDPNETEEQINLSGSASGMGFNAGIHIQAAEKLSFGLTHRSSITMKLEGGDVKIDAPTSLMANIPFENKFDTELPLPSTTTLGIAYNVSETILISVEGSMIGWSDYESLDFDFEKETESFKDSKNPRNYEDSYIVRFGMQFQVDTGFVLRFGGYYDQSPIQDEWFNPETPNSNNIGITGGMSYNFSNNIGLDLSIVYLAGKERTSYYTADANLDEGKAGENFGGRYKSNTLIPGIGFHFNF